MFRLTDSLLAFHRAPVPTKVVGPAPVKAAVVEVAAKAHDLGKVLVRVPGRVKARVQAQRPHEGPGSGTGSSQGASSGESSPRGIGLSELTFSLEVPVVEADLGYVSGEGTATYSVTYKPAEEGESNVEISLENFKPKCDAKLKEKFANGTTLSGGTTTSETEGSVEVGLDVPDGAADAKTSIDFKIVELDAEHAKVEFAVLSWTQTFPLTDGTFEVMGLTVKYSGEIDVKVEFTPNWEKIIADVAERLGVSVGEDAALGTAAGGTGEAGALAMASAPAVGIASGIVGGLALTAGVCAAIGALEDLGQDCAAVCQDGYRQLCDYARSYGSTMRGSPGSNAQGNQDAEARLQAMMQAAPGISHDQAVDIAKQSEQNFEDLAYRSILPTIREKVRQGYKDKHPVGMIFSFDTLERCLQEFLAEDSHYP